MRKRYLNIRVLAHSSIPISFPILFCAPILFGISGCSYRTEVVERYPQGASKVAIVYQKYPFSNREKTIKKIEYHFNGDRKKEFSLKDNVAHGWVREWWMTGHLRSAGGYSKSLRHGKWKFYYPGKRDLAEMGRYFHGEKRGRWTEFWPNGKKKGRGPYSANKKIGRWEYWDTLGQTTELNDCFKQNSKGEKIVYHPPHIVERYACHQGVPYGDYQRNHQDGTPFIRGQFDFEGRKVGNWEIFWQGGAFQAKESWVEGLRQDSLYRYDKKGRVILLGYFQAGSGEARYIDTQGETLKSISYARGKKHGPEKWFRIGGILEKEIYYLNGKATELREWYAPDTSGKTQLAKMGFFQTGKKNGLWQIYSPEGVLTESIQYSMGMRHGPTLIFDPKTGELRQTRHYHLGVIHRSELDN